MLGLGAPEIVLIIVGALLLFGYKKLPDASRSLGRSLRIFKSEMKGMKADDAAQDAPARDAATSAPVRGEIAVSSDGGDPTAQLEEEAHLAEVRAAELRARAEQTRSGSADGIR
jgi:sec-independent protein translocase protein TatA